ncbi:MAG TPA: aminoglycoside phosphotransferase, partial [Nitrosomonas sp.]|nr:aminoglycoside phosphotransferase [Nitrosomonas sp.]
GYLNDIPLVLHYLRKTCERYRELHLLKTLLDEIEDAPSPQQVGYTF